jgi:hypothetical protein
MNTNKRMNFLIRVHSWPLSIRLLCGSKSVECGLVRAAQETIMLRAKLVETRRTPRADISTLHETTYKQPRLAIY